MVCFFVMFVQELRGPPESLVSGAQEERTGPQEQWGPLALRLKRAAQEREGSRACVAPLDPADPQVTSPIRSPLTSVQILVTRYHLLQCALGWLV